MKNVARRLLLLAATLLMGGVIMLAPMGEAKAADATEISADGTYITGQLESKDDVNYYTFTAEEDGHFSVTCQKTSPSNNASAWYVGITDSNNTTLCSGYSSTTGTAYTSNDIPATAGSSYTIVISNYYSGASDTYDLKVDFVAASDWEKEDNDDKTTANKISKNATVYGNLYSTNDTDWYKIKVNKRGKISFSLTHATSSESGYWTFTLVDKKGNTLYSGHGASVNTGELGFRKDTVLYVEISAYSGGTAVGQNYQLTSSFTKTKKYEAEGNDTQKTANTLTSGTKYKGVLANSDDQDWFKFKMTKAGNVTLKFGPSDATNVPTYGWTVYLYDKNYNSVNVYSSSSNSVKNYKCYLKKGTYYISISTNLGSELSPVGYQYQLKLTETAKSITATPVIKSVSTGSSGYTTLNSITLSAKVPVATGYDVTVASDSGMSNVLLSKSYACTSKTITAGDYFNVPSSKIIYVRVKPYVEDPFGNKIYGTKSKVFKYTIK